MMRIILWIIGGLFIVTIPFSLWCCAAINAPRAKEEERRKFREDCEAFDAYMESRKKGVSK